jgi:tRNA pseudouridine32 synthase/23S rRNA pseudouridine746 synthase
MSKIKDSYFSLFQTNISQTDLPNEVSPFADNPPEIARIAANELQQYLENQTDFSHNFGLNEHNTQPIIGKMFGVLVVKTSDNTVGYLSAFSGKMAGKNDHIRFVPPIYDMLSSTGFISDGMKDIKQLTEKIVHASENKLIEDEILLKKQRANLSKRLQSQLFDEYNFVNEAKQSKNIIEIFTDYGYRQPPSAAGECSAPKLMQYAYQNNYTPIAIAEFWWGLSPKSDKWQHKGYYPACEEKCRPILSYMMNS